MTPEFPTPLPEGSVGKVSARLDALGRAGGDSELLCRMVLYLLTEHHLACPERWDPEVAEGGDVAFAARWLADRSGESVSIPELADRLHLSYTGFLWKFKREIGCTPSEFLISVRLSQAKSQLLEGDLPVGEIARRCGYANAYCFSFAFRKRYGLSPNAFRNEYLKKSL